MVKIKKPETRINKGFQGNVKNEPGGIRTKFDNTKSAHKQGL